MSLQSQVELKDINVSVFFLKPEYYSKLTVTLKWKQKFLNLASEKEERRCEVEGLFKKTKLYFEL